MANNTAAQLVGSELQFGNNQPTGDGGSSFIADESLKIKGANTGNLEVHSTNTTFNGNSTFQGKVNISGGLEISGTMTGNASSASQWANSRTTTVKVGNVPLGSVALNGSGDTTLSLSLLSDDIIRDKVGATSGAVKAPSGGIMPISDGGSSLGSAAAKFANVVGDNIYGVHKALTNPGTYFNPNGNFLDGYANSKHMFRATDAEFAVYGTFSSTGAINTQGSINATGTITGSKVYNAVWNDIADFFPIEDGTEVKPGLCYMFDGAKHRPTKYYGEKGALGIASDTFGFGVGQKENVNQLPVAIGGMVLAYTKRNYKSGTPLVGGKDGKLYRAGFLTRIINPHKIVATMYKFESENEWNGVVVDGRHWVKIK